MKKRKNKFLVEVLEYSFLVIVGLSMMLSFSSVSACTDGVGADCPPAGSASNIPAGSASNIPAGSASNVPAGSINISTGIKNPLGDNVKDLPTFIQSILNFVLVIGVPIVTLAIIYAGFLFVVARGNSEELTKAKKTLLYTLIGAALLLGSFVIAKAIQSTVVELSK